MNRRQPSPPSHLTRAQTLRHLNNAGFPTTLYRITNLAGKGQALEAEMWDGTLMIPRWRIMAYMDARQDAEAQG